MLAPLLAVALTVTGARVVSSARGLELVIESDAPIAADRITAEVDSQGLLATVRDADLRLSEMTFGAAPDLVRARRMERGVALELPITREQRCTQAGVTTDPAGTAVALRCEPNAPAAFTLAPEGTVFTTWLPAMLLALAAAAWALRRKAVGAPAHSLIEVLDTAHLGPKRSIVVARVGKERLILGTSEAGLALLAARPDEPSEPTPPHAQPRPATGHAPIARLAPRDFEAALHEATEDDELRRKLAEGMRRSS